MSMCVKDFNINILKIELSIKSIYCFYYSTLLVIIEKWKYPAPFRTRKSSTSSLIILQGPLVET